MSTRKPPERKMIFASGQVTDKQLAENNLKKQIVFSSVEEMQKSDYNPNASDRLQELKKSNDEMLSFVLEDNKKPKKNNAPRMAFTEDPVKANDWTGLFKTKNNLVPDFLKKQIRVQNHLVASILRSRSNQTSMFGHIRKNRFDVGVNIKVKDEFESIIKPEQMEVIQKRINRAEKLILTCGSEAGVKDKDKTTLSNFFNVQSSNGLTFGWFATEVIYSFEGHKRVFNRFRPVDAGTIHYIPRNNEKDAQAIRREALTELKNMEGIKDKLDPKIFEHFEQEDYVYVQVIDGLPEQAFTSDELIMTNMFPNTDVDFNGYPVAPIDTCITQITTHLSIDAYNRLYFQNGRAAKGMLILKSEDIDQATLESIKQQFFASINTVNNAFRVPIFGVQPTDDVQWQPMVANSTDGEFQYLSDQVSRCILASFGMSPDELPGYGHLSRGTNQQSLSESSNEYKLTAARDQGIRPLILQMQHFLSNKILPLIDPELAQICTIEMSGLDSLSRDQESLSLIQNSPTYYDMNGILKEVEKDTLPKRLAAEVLFNERWNLIMDKYVSVGTILSDLIDDTGAQLDIISDYKRDPFYFQNLQILMQTNPVAVQALHMSKPFAFQMLLDLIQDELDDEYSLDEEDSEDDSEETKEQDEENL